MNGGYFIDGVPYMDCKITGDPVRNVSMEATSVIGTRAVNAKINQMFPEQDKPKRIKTGRPAGWHWMAEFVDKDGTVYHKGKEQPNLKGTLPPTPKPINKNKLTKQEKDKLKNKLAQQMIFVRGELSKAKFKKDQKKFRVELNKIERKLKKMNWQKKDTLQPK